MLPHRFRNLALRLGKIEKLGDGGHVNPLRAGSAVTAVHTVSLPTDLRQGGKGGGIVLFLFAGLLIVQTNTQFLQSSGP